MLINYNLIPFCNKAKKNRNSKHVHLAHLKALPQHDFHNGIHPTRNSRKLYRYAVACDCII